MKGQNTPFAGFHDVVNTLEDLREIIGEPMPQVLAKQIDRLDDICRDFIARSPFCVIATANPDGHVDVSPKGDPAGFVRVVDDEHLVIPDRPGNRRIDSYQNLLRDARVGILFIIPGKPETLRVGGTARIVRDEDLLRSMAVNGKAPRLGLAVHVERIFMHCPKCMVRSRIWRPEAWPDSAGLADIGEAMIRHGKLKQTADELFAEVEREGITKLY